MARNLTQLDIDNLRPGPTRREIPDGKEPGLYLIQQPSGALSWALRYRLAGKPRKLTLGTYPDIGLRQARTLVSAARSRTALGFDPASEKQEQKAQRRIESTDLVERVIDLFVERHIKPNLRPQSARESTRILHKDILPSWRGRRLSEIKKSDIHDLLDRIADRGSPIQANRTFAAFRKLCSWALERGLIEVSPVAGIKAPAAETARDRVLADDELAAVWQACDRVGRQFGPLVRLLILTGQRRGEVAGMRWSEIDFDGKVWTLPASRTKNGIAHSIPLPPMAIEILQSLPRIKGNFVFTVNGTSPVAGFARTKERLDAELPKDMPRWTLHDLRRTFASGCARLGIAPHVTEAVLNHRSGTIRGVAATYCRYDYGSEKRGALETWGRYVEALVTGTQANVIDMRARA